jgi:hypothetical protein
LSEVERLSKHQHVPSGKEALWERLETVWESIGHDVIDPLYESMPRRVVAVLEAAGKHTRY